MSNSLKYRKTQLDRLQELAKRKLEIENEIAKHVLLLEKEYKAANRTVQVMLQKKIETLQEWEKGRTIDLYCSIVQLRKSRTRRKGRNNSACFYSDQLTDWLLDCYLLLPNNCLKGHLWLDVSVFLYIIIHYRSIQLLQCCVSLITIIDRV